MVPCLDESSGCWWLVTSNSFLFFWWNFWFGEAKRCKRMCSISVGILGMNYIIGGWWNNPIHPESCFFSTGMYSCICIHKVRGQKDKVRGQKSRFPRICIYIWYIYVYCYILIPLLTWVITIALIPLWCFLRSTSLKGNKASLFLQLCFRRWTSTACHDHESWRGRGWAGDGMGFGWCPICPEIPWLQHVPIYMGHTLNQPTSRFTSSETSIDLSKTWLCDNFPVECYERCDLGLHWLPFSLCLSAFVWILATSCDNNWKGSQVCRIGQPSYTALLGIVWDWRTWTIGNPWGKN